MAFAYFRMPIGPLELLRRTVREIIDDDCLGLAAQLSFYFLLALFPALLFVVALIGALPVSDVVQRWLDSLSGVMPGDFVRIIRTELGRIAAGDSASLLTFSILGALWSSSTGMVAIISTVNTAYDLEERRSWWKVRLLAIGLTLLLVVFMIVAQLLLQAGPWALDELTRRTGIDLGTAGVIAQWLLALGALVVAIDVIYQVAPAARSEFTWLTPGAVVAVALWVGASLGFRAYLQHVGGFGATYGTLGGVIVVMLWFYLSGLAVLVGAEINSEIEHASRRRRAAGGGPEDEPVIGAAADREEQAARQRTPTAAGSSGS